MKLIEGFKLFWTRALDFRGRSSRSEFWWGVLGNSVIMVALIVLLVVSLTCLSTPINAFSITMIVLFALFCVVEFIPSLSLMIRRMHDIGKSGYYILVLLIPVLGYFWYMYLVTRPSAGSDEKVTQNDEITDEIAQTVAEANLFVTRADGFAPQMDEFATGMHEFDSQTDKNSTEN